MPYYYIYIRIENDPDKENIMMTTEIATEFATGKLFLLETLENGEFLASPIFDDMSPAGGDAYARRSASRERFTAFTHVAGSLIGTTADQVAEACTRDDAGRHFSEWLDWEKLEQAGLIEIYRPVHQPSGVPYSMGHWSLRVTDAGAELAN